MKFEDLKKFTQARVGMGHAGGAIKTSQWLSFAYEHAAAVDAVHIPWEFPKNPAFQFDVLKSNIADRREYLQRPDLGRSLAEESGNDLKKLKLKGDILIVVSNGLSSFAVHNHLDKYLKYLLSDIKTQGLTVLGNRIFFVPNARVALIDQIGEILKSKISLMIIGERPGLSSPDSLACYLTYKPKKGLSDANRNCISNIRPPFGLSYKEASLKTMYLLEEALKRKLSGVNLKDESDNLEYETKNQIDT